jgi:hypothetical protein
MARKQNAQPAPQPAQLSPEQVRQAIPRLEKRIDELSRLNFGSLTEETGDNALLDQMNKINDTLIDIYGHNMIEYKRYKVSGLHAYPVVLYSGQDTSFRARLPDIKSAVASALTNLKSALDICKEKVGGGDASGLGGVIRAYQGLELHSKITRAASQLYLDGHYSNAVEAAVKALNGLVRVRSGLEIDGVSLMERAFSPNGPVLKFNALANQLIKMSKKGSCSCLRELSPACGTPGRMGFSKMILSAPLNS